MNVFPHILVQYYEGLAGTANSAPKQKEGFWIF